MRARRAAEKRAGAGGRGRRGDAIVAQDDEDTSDAAGEGVGLIL